MKKFIVAAFCTLMMSGSLLAQDAANVAPATPGEDVAVQEVAPVADAAPATGSFVVSPQAAGCVGCGSVVAAPMMTYTQAPATGCCGQAAPATDCCAPVEPTCCDPCDPCCNQRQGFRARRQARVAQRRARGNNCCY